MLAIVTTNNKVYLSYMSKYTKELLEPIVLKSKSITDVLKQLGLVTKGGNFATIKKHIIRCDIDTSHFTGQGWSRGQTAETNVVVARITATKRIYTVETSLINGIKLPSKALRRLVVEAGLEQSCEWCTNSGTWNGQPLVLHVDHIDGDNYNNELSNLRFLCPNCHSQTETFCSRNAKYRQRKYHTEWIIKEKVVKEKVVKTAARNKCLQCGELCNRQCTFCSTECSHKNQQKSSKSSQEIYELWIINDKNFLKTSRDLGISDNAIRKRLRTAGLID